MKQKTLTDPALPLPNPHLINLDTDPKEREPANYPYLHTWVGAHVAKILKDYQDSLSREPLIPLGSPLDYVPKVKPRRAARCDAAAKGSGPKDAHSNSGVSERPLFLLTVD